MVFGVPLLEWERVLYFRRPSRTLVVVLRVVLGICALPILPLSIWLFWAAATDRAQGVYAHVITDRRLLAITGKGTVKWEVRWEHFHSAELLPRGPGVEVRTKGAPPVYLEEYGRAFAAKLTELGDAEVRLRAPIVDYVEEPLVRRRRG